MKLRNFLKLTFHFNWLNLILTLINIALIVLTVYYYSRVKSTGQTINKYLQQQNDTLTYQVEFWKRLYFMEQNENKSRYEYENKKKK